MGELKLSCKNLSSKDLAVQFWRRHRVSNTEEASRIATHETLHSVMPKGMANTVFVEALFDVLCSREQAGLWFAEEAFNKIRRFLE